MNDIEEAISFIKSAEKHLRSIGESWFADYLDDAIDLLKGHEAVVLCKDCKYCKVIDWDDSNPYYGSCQYFNTHTVDADGFCYKAERKGSD